MHFNWFLSHFKIQFPHFQICVFFIPRLQRSNINDQKRCKYRERSIFSPVFIVICKNPPSSFLLKVIRCGISNDQNPPSEGFGTNLGELAVPFVTSQRLSFKTHHYYEVLGLLFLRMSVVFLSNDTFCS